MLPVQGSTFPGFLKQALAFSIPRQVADDLSREELVNFVVSRYRLRRPGLWVVVDIMLPSVTKEYAPATLNLADERLPLHPTSISSTFLIPGRPPLLNS